ncbi:helix-turn-helix domain-containing protein [Allorhizobium undicola]|uniref:helix-turn-helix domain-containing protein n=1 Tax=Allorhizobium undicola TaxID=78527 RepID=UPI003D34657A
MIFLPVPFFVSFLLMTFLLRMVRLEDERRPALPFLVLLGLMVVQVLLVGLRWGYGISAVMPLMASLASFVPPLSWLAFSTLSQKEAQPGGQAAAAPWRAGLPHLALPVCVVVMMVAGGPVDAALILGFAGYGLALLWKSRLGPDGLTASRLDGALRSWRSMQISALTLIGSALSDIAISLDLAFGTGRMAPAIVSGFSTLVLFALGYAASRMDAIPQPEASVPQGQREVEDSTARAATGEDAAIAARLEELMVEKQLFRDPDLNLARLSRRLGLPARAVSNAVNRAHGMSVSQYVNNHRVQEACRLLQTTQLPITHIAFEAGFMTKSNFNREFLRVTAMSPSRWRLQHTT